MTQNIQSGPDASDSPIVRRKLSDEVFDRLRNMIASGELSAGDAIPSERALMERYGVGRPAVREALQSLQTRGLITISHGERSRVNALTAGLAFQQLDEVVKLLLSSEPSNLGHLKELRRLFEVGIISAAAEKSTAADIRELREQIRVQRSHIGDSKAFVQADMAFHARVAKLSGNPLIGAVSEAMLKWLFEYHASILHWSGHEDTTLQEHDAIVDCLENRDGPGAIRVMEQHLNRSDPMYRHHE